MHIATWLFILVSSCSLAWGAPKPPKPGAHCEWSIVATDTQTKGSQSKVVQSINYTYSDIAQLFFQAAKDGKDLPTIKSKLLGIECRFLSFQTGDNSRQFNEYIDFFCEHGDFIAKPRHLDCTTYGGRADRELLIFSSKEKKDSQFTVEISYSQRTEVIR
jgi:hypothetical protein